MSAERDPAPDCIHHFTSKKGHHYVKRTRSDNQTLASYPLCSVRLRNVNGQTAIIRRMSPDDAERVCSIVRKVFGKLVAPHYSQEGIQEFHRYIDPELLARRIQNDHVAWVAESDAGIAIRAGGWL